MDQYTTICKYMKTITCYRTFETFLLRGINRPAVNRVGLLRTLFLDASSVAKKKQWMNVDEEILHLQSGGVFAGILPCKGMLFARKESFRLTTSKSPFLLCIPNSWTVAWTQFALQ